MNKFTEINKNINSNNNNLLNLHNIHNSNIINEPEQLFYDFIKIMNQLRKEIISGKNISNIIIESFPKIISIKEQLACNEK